jgi:predicted dehydrogenase
MRHIRVGVVGQSLDAVLLTQSWRLLNGTEVVPIQLADDYQHFVPAIRENRLGGVALCAPMSKRLTLIRKALEEGLPVLAETPLAGDLDSIGNLLEERLKRGGPPLIPITPWRFAPDLQLARGILAGGALGSAISFRVTMPGPEALLSPNAASTESSYSAAAIILQQGWVAMDLVRHLFGDVHWVQATRLRGSGNNGPAFEGVEILMKCSGGWSGTVCLSSEPADPKSNWVVINGSEAALELGWRSSMFVPAEGDAARIGQGCFGIENYERLANAFADVAAFRVSPWVTDIDLIRTLDLVQAANLSLGAGLAVDAPRRQRSIAAA